jgi:hypothetical protein
MSINEIKRPGLPGLPRPSLNRPSLPSPDATPQGARSRGSNAASDALPTRAASRASVRSPTRPDSAMSIAANVGKLFDSGALRLRENVSSTVVNQVLLSAARKVLDLSKAFPQRAA